MPISQLRPVIRPDSSGCAVYTPLSITATSAPCPLVSSHAPSAPVRRRFQPATSPFGAWGSDAYTKGSLGAYRYSARYSGVTLRTSVVGELTPELADHLSPRSTVRNHSGERARDDIRSVRPITRIEPIPGHREHVPMLSPDPAVADRRQRGGPDVDQGRGRLLAVTPPNPVQAPPPRRIPARSRHKAEQALPPRPRSDASSSA